MAIGRTISANLLTELDQSVIETCELMAQEFISEINGDENKESFKKDYGKISYTRDSGIGLGGGKIQRDALCTRGIQGKAPFSNRNLRWHPLVASETKINFAQAIERIEIEGEDEAQILIFVIKDSEGNELSFPSEKTFELPKRYVVLPSHWMPHLDRLRHWSGTLWTQNSCIITSYESCNWWDALEAYAVLGISIVCDFYNVNSSKISKKIYKVLDSQNINVTIDLPSDKFPLSEEDIVNCPLCKVNKNTYPANLPQRIRVQRWKPAWGRSKRSEGDDSSLQIMHVNPLIESEIRHNAENVRFGHRWCNVSMTDHSIDETLNFMEYIVRVHNRCK